MLGDLSGDAVPFSEAASLPNADEIEKATEGGDYQKQHDTAFVSGVFGVLFRRHWGD